MAKGKKRQPPFAWLGRFRTPVGLGLIAAVAAFFRFYQLGSLPPGVDEASARIGLQSLGLGGAGWLPTMDFANGYAPLWIWLQAATIQLFGHTALALQIWPATLGTLAVVITWLWLRAWFDVRVAWIGAFTMAVTPWAFMLSRNGLAAAALPLLTSLTLWLSVRALQQPTAGRYAVLAAVLSANLLSGPMGWLLTASVLTVGAWRLAASRSLTFTQPRAVGAAVLAVGAATMAYLVARSLPSLQNLPRDLNLASNPGELGHNLLQVGLMFNAHGDESYLHNLAGEPLLNSFLGLMLVAGLLVSISRAHHLRYRILLLLTLVMLLPAIIITSGVPNSTWAAGALPLIFALVGIGTAYMLELWYATFPINSAARATGRAAIILLLALSLLQGYTQYFNAWAGSTPVYVAYNEGVVKIAERLRTDKAAAERFVVLSPEQAPVVNYLAYGITSFRVVTPAALTALPIAAGTRQFYIGASVRDETVKTLKSKFPGGILVPHYSEFNLVEYYYTYEVAK